MLGEVLKHQNLPRTVAMALRGSPYQLP